MLPGPGASFHRPLRLHGGSLKDCPRVKGWSGWCLKFKAGSCELGICKNPGFTSMGQKQALVATQQTRVRLCLYGFLFGGANLLVGFQSYEPLEHSNRSKPMCEFRNRDTVACAFGFQAKVFPELRLVVLELDEPLYLDLAARELGLQADGCYWLPNNMVGLVRRFAEQSLCTFNLCLHCPPLAVV